MDNERTPLTGMEAELIRLMPHEDLELLLDQAQYGQQHTRDTIKWTAELAFENGEEWINHHPEIALTYGRELNEN